MKITRRGQEVRFELIPLLSVFRIDDLSGFYIKTSHKVDYNSISLDNLSVITTNKDSIVRIVDAELILP